MTRKKNNPIYLKRLSILKASKSIVSEKGWNDNTFRLISKKTKFKQSVIIILFPDGYKDLLLFSMDHLNNNLEEYCKKINFLKLPLHKRIKKILLKKIHLINKDKIFYKKVYFNILIPRKKNILLKQLYNSVDQIWHIAGDTSTDFNFYSKRIILSGIYFRLMMSFFNNNNIRKVEQLLDNSLRKVSKIPKIKARFNLFKSRIPSLAKLVSNY